ncbi:PKD domain-containing protein [uncultured Eudoraea sp.]|uniref:PKD domain-containing protein n=1 Tax=uncultured Eudoraea sp. TaxID=1035614 RepID=UPI00260268A9|nr:PKD domain-containing protein [uncultured Eudoraea sp.]
MKKIYFLIILAAFFTSCSKDTSPSEPDNPDPNSKLVACFEMSKEILLVGENLQISNCSVGAIAYSYNLGNGETRTEENPTVVYGKPGDYTIALTVSNEAMETKTFSQQILVNDAVVQDFFIFPEIADGFNGIPMETGVNQVNGLIYSIELLEDLAGTGGAKFYYRELDENYLSSSNYLADKPYNSNSAFVNFYPSGNMNFVFSRTLDGLYGTQEVTYNNAWNFMNGISPSTKHSYGFLAEGTNFYYFGTAEDVGIYKAAVETRNSSGDAFAVVLNSFGDADSMIGDMIKVENGYLAFGAVFSKNDTNPKITNYKPLLIFFDIGLNVTSHVIYEDSVLDSKISSANDLNGSYHLEQLSNGNIAMYANGELTVANATGAKIASSYFEGTKNNQAMVSLGDSFVLSSDENLRKFDQNGSQIKELNYPGNYLPEILNKNGNLFFIAGFDIEGEVKLLYGLTDNDLNPINLNE